MGLGSDSRNAVWILNENELMLDMEDYAGQEEDGEGEGNSMVYRNPFDSFSNIH